MSADGPIDLAQQLLAHLESLRAAGIQFVPRGALLELPNFLRVKAESAPPVRLGQTLSTTAALPVSSSAPSLRPPSPVSPPDSPEGRRQALVVLAKEISTCDRCSELYSTRTQTVFGVGPVDPEVAFVGEAPGADEDRQGEPFVGRAGQLLTKIIVACGFARNDVYIFNTLKCRPPNNRQPTSTECENCRPFFQKQFDLVNPKYVVALGATAAKNLLQTTESVGRLRGQIHTYRHRPLICTWHPSALLRDETGLKKRECWEDMKFLLRTMGRPIPDVKRND